MSLNPKPKQYISIPELAKVLGISRIAVFKKVKSGQIKAIKIGRSYAIPRTYVSEISDKVPEQYFTNFLDRETYYSVPELAQKLGISRIAVFHKIKKGQIKAFKVGRHYAIPKDYDAPAPTEQEVRVSEALTTPERSLAEIQDEKVEKTFQLSQKPYVSVPELAKILGVSRITVFQYIKKGQIKATRVGRHYVVPRDFVPGRRGGEVPEQPKKDKDYISIADLAKKMGLSRIAVFHRIKKGQIKGTKIGRSYAISVEEIERLGL